MLGHIEHSKYLEFFIYKYELCERTNALTKESTRLYNDSNISHNLDISFMSGKHKFFWLLEFEYLVVDYFYIPQPCSQD